MALSLFAYVHEARMWRRPWRARYPTASLPQSPSEHACPSLPFLQRTCSGGPTNPPPRRQPIEIHTTNSRSDLKLRSSDDWGPKQGPYHDPGRPAH